MNQITEGQTNFDQIKEKLEQFTVSTYGKQLVRDLKPSATITVVEARLKETKEARLLLESNLHLPLMGLLDLERLTEKIDKGLILEPTELIEYADFLRSNRLMLHFFEKNQELTPLLFQYSQGLKSFPDIEETIYQTVKNNQVSDDSSKALRRIRRDRVTIRKQIEDSLNRFMRQDSNQQKIQELLIMKRDSRYCVPLKASYKNQLSGNVVGESSKGSTVYFEPIKVAKLNEQNLLLEAEEVAEVYQILAFLTGTIAEQMLVIKQNIEIIAAFDVILAKGKYSRELNGIQPKVNREGRIHLVNAKHPLLGEHAVPLNLTLGENYRGLTITGPNAGGKTVVLKTVGLLSLQTMIGLQIPADKGTEIALFDQIFLDIGDQQSLENALSTFSGHLQNLAKILKETKKNSLILLDEIGSGTEPNEGAALAIAIMERFYQKGSILITTTHYGEIKRFSEAHEDFCTAAMDFDPETLSPKYQLMQNQVGESHAFWLARRMNVEEEIVKQAQIYLTNHEYKTEKIAFQLVAEKKKEEVYEKQMYQKGDRVFWLEKNQIALVYQKIENDKVEIYVENRFIQVPEKRLRLEQSAEELYPVGYDLEQLFSTYDQRKEKHDLERGSKKARKKLDKEQRERRKKLS